MDTGFEFVGIKGSVPTDLDLLHVDRIPCSYWEFWRAQRVEKVVAHVHGNLIYTNPELCEMSTRRRTGMFLGELMGRCMVDHFTPVSRYLADWMDGRGYDPERITPIHNGVNPIFFNVPVSPFKIEGDYLLHVSKWQPKKNTNAIVEAMPLIKEKFPDMHLVIAGPRHQAQPYADEPYVTVLGKVPLEWLPQIYFDAKVFVFPSLHETFGIPVAEAMAVGTPVVTSMRTSLPEICGEAAEYCIPTPHGIATTVLGVLEDRAKRKAMRKAGWALARQYTWEKAAEKMVKVYEKVLA
jgi:glycosyltransferase involved in cell wall biosynthesis